MLTHPGPAVSRIDSDQAHGDDAHISAPRFAAASGQVRRVNGRCPNGVTRRIFTPPPEDLAVDVASRLRRTAAAAGVEVAWIEAPLDGEFSPVCQHRADAGLSWLTAAAEAVAAPLEVTSLGEFEPDVWLPGTHPAAPGRVIGLGELAALDIIHGPRRLGTVTYDLWQAVIGPAIRASASPTRRSAARCR